MTQAGGFPVYPSRPTDLLLHDLGGLAAWAASLGLWLLLGFGQWEVSVGVLRVGGDREFVLFWQQVWSSVQSWPSPIVLVSFV